MIMTRPTLEERYSLVILFNNEVQKKKGSREKWWLPSRILEWDGPAAPYPVRLSRSFEERS
jgi:hypothetical protein